jgi:hypothetical protein
MPLEKNDPVEQVPSAGKCCRASVFAYFFRAVVAGTFCCVQKLRLKIFIFSDLRPISAQGSFSLVLIVIDQTIAGR